MPEIRNLPVERAAAELADKLERRSVAPSGTRFEGDYEEASASLQRLEDEGQVGHGPKSK